MNTMCRYLNAGGLSSSVSSLFSPSGSGRATNPLASSGNLKCVTVQEFIKNWKFFFNETKCLRNIILTKINKDSELWDPIQLINLVIHIYILHKKNNWGGFTLWLKQENCVRIKRQLATKLTMAHRKSYCTDFNINPWAWSLTFNFNHINFHAFLFVAFLWVREFSPMFLGEKKKF